MCSNLLSPTSFATPLDRLSEEEDKQINDIINMRHSSNIIPLPQIIHLLKLQQRLHIIRHEKRSSRPHARVLPVDVRGANNSRLEQLVIRIHDPPVDFMVLGAVGKIIQLFDLGNVVPAVGIVFPLPRLLSLVGYAARACEVDEEAAGAFLGEA